MRLHSTIVIALAASFSIAPLTASAWHEKGHMMVAAVAWEQMTPATRTRAIQLLKINPDYNTWINGVPDALKDKVAFMRTSVWPDDIKRKPDYMDDGDTPPHQGASLNEGYSDKRMHKYWHYKDLPLRVGTAPFADPPSPNAETQIIAFRDAIASATQSDNVKSYDVAWLIHIVGDVHQPLHSTSRFTKNVFRPPDGDRGGNSVKLSCCGGNLHTFWDAAIGDSEDHNVAIAAAAALPAAPAEAVAKTNPASWIVESFVIAKSEVYRSPVKAGKGPFNLTNNYKNRARKLSERRIAIAGARLAKLFNDHLR